MFIAAMPREPRRPRRQLGAIDADFVRNNLYEGILGRDPLATNDAEGLAYWVNEANTQGWTQDQLTAQFLTSAKAVLTDATAAQRAYLAPAVFSSQPAPVTQVVQPTPPQVQTMLPKMTSIPESIFVQPPTLLPQQTPPATVDADDSGKKALLIGAVIGAALWLRKKKG